MTQKTYSVSPLIPACPKPGASSPAFRPADLGDTTAHIALFQPMGQSPAPSYPRGTIIPRASVLECGRPLPLFTLNSQRSTLNFVRKYLITSLFSAARRPFFSQLSTLNPQLL